MTERTFSLTASQLDMVCACIGRAETEGAFAGCVVPSIGAKVLAMLENIRAADVATEAAARVTVHGKPWAGSPPHYISGRHSDLVTLQAAGMAARTLDGWWIPTAAFPS